MCVSWRGSGKDGKIERRTKGVFEKHARSRLTELLATEVEFRKLYWQIGLDDFYFIKYQRGRGKKKERAGSQGPRARLW